MQRKNKLISIFICSLAIFFVWSAFGFAATEDANVSISIVAPGQPPGDQTPPIISNIQVINITTTSATITWETDELATSILYYGETDSYGSQVDNINFLTSHSVDLTNLTPDTEYHFKIWVRDSNFNPAESTDQTFTTLSDEVLYVPGAPTLLAISPSIINIVLDPNNNEDDVLFLINETSTGLYLQSDGTLDMTEDWQSYNSWGSLLGKNITGLSENTEYTFQVMAKDNTEQSEWSDSASKYTLINKPDELVLVNTGSDFITIEANGSLPNLGDGLTALWFENIDTGQNSDWITDTTWTNIGLSPSTDYSFRVKARNGDGEETDFTDLSLFFTSSVLPACSDGIDNDDDGLVDYPADPGCDGSEDNDETDVEVLPQCSDDIDNDNDGLIDYPADPGCDSSEDNDETDIEVLPACSDQIDNDGDGLIDYPADPGCSFPEDNNEFNVEFVPQCSDDVDNDNDGLIDYPADPGCSSEQDNNEEDEAPVTQCSDGVDNDDDGFIDYPADPGCDSPEDNNEVEEELITQCSDGIDNDNDGLTDWPTDPGCETLEDDDETDEVVEYQCSDGIDNDNDGLTDYPADPGCQSAEDDDEIDELILPQCSDGLDNDADGFIDLADPDCESELDNTEETEQIEIVEPTEIIETLRDLLDRISDSNFVNAIRESYIVNNILNNPKVEEATDRFGTPAVAVVLALNILSVASLAGLLPYLFFLLSEPLLVIFKKKRKKFGVVYDSITKRPVDLAILRLYNASNNKLIQTKVSDKEGRFSFVVKPGTYYIKVFKKDYLFPTQVLAAQKEDLFYIDLYHGENIQVDEKAVITPNIPLDADKKPKPSSRVMMVYFLRKAQKFFAVLGPIATFIVFIIKPSLLFFVLLILHLILYAIFKRLAVPKKPKGWGIVADKTSKSPLGRSVVRLYDNKYHKLLETQVTDPNGRYSFLVGKNVYYITSEKKGYSDFKSDVIEQKKEKGEVLTQNILMDKEGAPKVPEPKVEEKKEPKLERKYVRNLPHQWHGDETAQEIKEEVSGKEFEHHEKAKDINLPWSEQ